MMRSTRPLCRLVMASAWMTTACDPHVTPDYPGEPLAALAGTVDGASLVPSSDPQLSVAWAVASEELGCEGPAQSCFVGVSFGEQTDIACVEACGETQGCGDDELATWSACIDACHGVAEIETESVWGLCYDTTLGETAPLSITGMFPASFEFDLYQPPPASTLMESEGVKAALGYFVVIDPSLGDTSLFGWIDTAPGDPVPPPPPGVLGGSETKMLLYAQQPIVAGSAWATVLGGAYAAGYHVLDVVPAVGECYVYGSEDVCTDSSDTLAPSAEDLQTPIDIVMGSAYEVDWPYLSAG